MSEFSTTRLSTTRLVRSGRQRLFTSAIRPVAGSSAAAFRIAFGILALIAILRLFANGWIDDLYIHPTHHFAYRGFGWIQPWPGYGMYIHFAALAALSIGIVIGFHFRLCAILFFLGFTYVELIDRVTYLNHHYWMSVAALLIAFLPLNRIASVDAWRNPSIRQDTVQTWVLWTLRAQVGVVYIFAGIAKLNPDWLLLAQPLRIWLYQHGDMPIIGAILQETWTAYAMSWAGALFDLTIVGWLLWHRTRLAAYIALIAFHLATWLLFPKLGIFPWLMIAGAAIFLRPEWPSMLLGKVPARLRFPRKTNSNLQTPSKTSPQTSSASRAVIAGIVILALAQILTPLRHFAYPGNVRWTEEGYLFAWRVMLTEKAGIVNFRVQDPRTGRAWHVSPDDLLTPLQVERMAFQPDLILQTAHFIADDFYKRGYPEVAVTADAFVSWNGRPNRRLIDPNTDLASIEYRLAFPPTHSHWILPYQTSQSADAPNPSAPVASAIGPRASRKRHTPIFQKSACPKRRHMRSRLNIPRLIDSPMI